MGWPGTLVPPALPSTELWGCRCVPRLPGSLLRVFAFYLSSIVSDFSVHVFPFSLSSAIIESLEVWTD